jgi:hypothetical protein
LVPEPEGRKRGREQKEVLPSSLGEYSNEVQKALQDGFTKRQKVKEFGNTVEEVLR